MKIYTPRPGFGIFGACLAVCGLVSGIFYETIFNRLLQKAISLHPNSNIFDIWRAPPKVFIDVYIFNWTNPDDFYNASMKPILQQVGPYRFIEVSDKVNISWHPENGTVSYSKRCFYYFDAEASSGHLNDTIVTVNIVPLTAVRKIKRWPFLQRKMATMALNIYAHNLVVESTVDEILFTGHDDKFLSAAYKVQNILKESFPYDKFGYGYLRNGSTQFWGSYNIYTGADDFANIGKIHSWNYKQQNERFGSDCGTLNAAAGEYQTPNLKVNSTVSYYIPDICRSFPLDYEQQVEVNGVTAFKYIAGLRSMDNGTLYPENKCYCVDECIPSGVMNIAHCWFDMPVHVSFPHFYNADPCYLNAVEGLHPNKEQHEMFIILERRTGLPQQISARFQVNLLVEPVAEFRFLENAPRIIFPILWIDFKSTVPHEIVWRLQLLPILHAAGRVATAVSMLVGVAMLMGHLCARFKMQTRQKATFADPVYGKQQLYQAESKAEAADSLPLLEEVKSICGTNQNDAHTNSYG